MSLFEGVNIISRAGIIFNVANKRTIEGINSVFLYASFIIFIAWLSMNRLIKHRKERIKRMPPTI